MATEGPGAAVSLRGASHGGPAGPGEREEEEAAGRAVMEGPQPPPQRPAPLGAGNKWVELGREAPLYFFVLVSSILH